MKKNYTILSIETSLDDTCAAITTDDRVISNVIASQVDFHAEFGGTVPDIAKRKHLEWIDAIVTEALQKAKKSMADIDAIAVTYGPGLAPSLEVGIAKAVELASSHDLPLLATNHMEGHLLSSFAANSAGTTPFSAKNTSPQYPALGFLISGGHTQLVLMKAIGDYQIVGQTLDDAAGEAYDKVGRMLKLGYPGGPLLAKLAKTGNPNRFPLPEPMKHRQDLNFSFSGLKTAALYELRKHPEPYSAEFCADFAASFQQAVILMLTRRFKKALQIYKPKMVLLGGGVVSNLEIRSTVRKIAKDAGIPTYIPYSKKLFTDNAAMIGIAAYHMAKRGLFWDMSQTLDRVPNLSIESSSS